jgi:hypothetical protein
MSADPARSWRPAAAPNHIALRVERERSSRSVARSTHGIQAAPARWSQLLARESQGPDDTQTPAPANAAAAPRPSVRQSR